VGRAAVTRKQPAARPAGRPASLIHGHLRPRRRLRTTRCARSPRGRRCCVGGVVCHVRYDGDHRGHSNDLPAVHPFSPSMEPLMSCNRPEPRLQAMGDRRTNDGTFGRLPINLFPVVVQFECCSRDSHALAVCVNIHCACVRACVRSSHG